MGRVFRLLYTSGSDTDSHTGFVSTACTTPFLLAIYQCSTSLSFQVVLCLDKYYSVCENKRTMQRNASFPEIMTPEQAAEYLQVSRETVYRYIRQGKLAASRLGRSYRLEKRNLDLLLWGNRTNQTPLRQYTPAEVEAFLRDDALGTEATEIAKRFLAGSDLTARS